MSVPSQRKTSSTVSGWERRWSRCVLLGGKEVDGLCRGTGESMFSGGFDGGGCSTISRLSRQQKRRLHGPRQGRSVGLMKFAWRMAFGGIGLLGSFLSFASGFGVGLLGAWRSALRRCRACRGVLFFHLFSILFLRPPKSVQFHTHLSPSSPSPLTSHLYPLPKPHHTPTHSYPKTPPQPPPSSPDHPPTQSVRK